MYLSRGPPANTLNIVDMLGHTDIPVAKGTAAPLKRELHCAISHGKTGLGDVVVPDSERDFYEKDAADTIYEAAVKHKGELIVLATGPQNEYGTCNPASSGNCRHDQTSLYHGRMSCRWKYDTGFRV